MELKALGRDGLSSGGNVDNEDSGSSPKEFPACSGFIEEEALREVARKHGQEYHKSHEKPIFPQGKWI